jgi:hypothetical protein
LLNAWLILVPLLLLPPVMPETCVTVHENVVPLTLELKLMPVVWPLQIVCVDGVVVIEGVGLTVITTFVPLPAHVLALGVT